ncbi:MAG: glycosyltransferase involved in cell wall biosynthesis [Candidatus Binatia bacterium]|jgi:glycosyltransferase involved in cell wall biosynthesis
MNTIDFVSDPNATEGASPTEGSPWNVQQLGIQVVISAHNAARWFERCLLSVERSLAGYRWILIIADDGSEDETLEIAVNHPTSAQFSIIRAYPKAANVSVAKNRAYSLALKNSTNYPAIVSMDADDEMLPPRISHLLPFAVAHGHHAVFGDYIYECPAIPERHERIVKARSSNIKWGNFGPPMTLFHASLIPRDGVLFREDMRANSDCELWDRWTAEGVEIVPAPGPMVHRYHYRLGSTSNPVDQEKREENIEALRVILESRGMGVETISEEAPKVSSLMLTGKSSERYALARVAVDCWRAQSWENRELVIVNHGGTPLANGDPRIREMMIERPEGMTLGEMRNLSLEHATGEYVVQWDDDDWHHPKRIETLMEFRDRGEVVTLGWQVRINIQSRAAYYSRRDGGQHNAILHRRNVPYRYPRLNAGEDTMFLGQFNSKSVVDNGPHESLGPMLYVRTFHGENIWDEAHVMEDLAGQAGIRQISKADDVALSEVEALYADYLKICPAPLESVLAATDS